MRRITLLLISILFAACTPLTSEISGSSTPTDMTGSVSTASVGTVEPEFATEIPPDYTPPATSVPPTTTLIPTLTGGLGPSELKYRLLEEFPNLFFCDPDYYPVAHADELVLAKQRFPELQANVEEFNTILNQNNLTGLTTFTDDQILLVYGEHKKLAAIPFELSGEAYHFQMQVAETEGEGELITGWIDSQGSITGIERTPTIVTCPICLAAGTLIDTPDGPVPVQNLRTGMLVWTVDAAGDRIPRPLVRVGKTTVPTNHKMLHIELEDGRELFASPGHPTSEGIKISQLEIGDFLDGAKIISIRLYKYSGSSTYDVLPDSETGLYWTNGILLASTLK